MKQNTKHYPLYQRLLSFAMAALMVFGIIPLDTRAATTAEEYTVEHISTVADDQTIGRPGSVYGDNTLNAGKVTVGKSVHDGAVSLTYGGNKTQTFTPAEHNFIVTSSQAAQIMGLASESAAPVDVVFVLDTSSSMSGGRATSMVTAANNAISSLMAANPYNRIGVVAFSSNAWSDNTVAAEILSALAHYDDVDSNGDGDFSDRNDSTAASNHLCWGSSNGAVSNNGSYIIGRGTNAGTRHGVDGGTNIHAGIALAAEMLTNATSTTVQIDGKNVTRMPFLVVLSDGAPTYSSYTSDGSDTKWYDPNMTSEHGPGDAFYVGNGFLAALTAAYYKGVITEKYFGINASEKNRCYIYTIGVGLGNLRGDEGALAQITMDPDTYFKTGSTNKFYNNNGNNDFYSYWGKYTAANPARFTVQVNGGNNSTTTISVDSINATKNYVNGLNSSGTKMYDGGLAYNDDYYTADQTADINNAFEKALMQIQQQAMSAPTRVEETHGADFSGYVTYTDPIGEYMEVKKIFGVVADGNYYQGKTFAQNMQNWNNGTTQEFKDQFLKVLKERCRVTGASLTDAQLQSIIAKAVASDKQAYYKSDADYDNSFVWWGKSYTAPGEEDVQIQLLDFAEDDSIEYITTAAIPDGADYVCRSYYFYGEAGGTAVNPNHEYLHFVVRVQRSLKAPYQETVVISAPSSLLSMEKVLITEKTNASGETTYTANITEAEPARVVYEVGLRSDINAFNVDEILAEDTAYLGETAVNGGQTVYTNYDAAKGEYYFYTNDWNRAESESSHHRAMAHATFDAAADNAFYTYTKDTPIYTKNGDTYTLYNGTNKPSGTYYYAREVYDWSASTAAGNTHTAVKRTEYIEVNIPANADAVKQGTDGWYITKGVYKASSLSTAVEDVPKDPNRTGTATIVAHPHRTEDANNSHYTVLLGNNGKLTLKAADTKSVSITKPNTPVITDGNGKVVMVGDELTYTIKVINGERVAADATVTDQIPAGTEFVSAADDGRYDASTNSVVWNISALPAGHYAEVSFTVRVTEAALSGELDVVTIDNQAYVELDNGFEYKTNITKNPPEGKKVVDTNGATITGSVDIPDVLVYRIRWHNDSGSTADVTVTDIIPSGTSYVENSASHNGVYDAAAKTITWTLEDVEAGASGVVSFRVNVNAAAGNTIENDAEIQIGDNKPRVTNKTSVTVDKGDLVLSKDVVANGFAAAENQEFTLRITEAGLGMNGTFTMLKNGAAVDGGITFTNGTATVTIKHDDVIEIQGITAGAIISVSEDAKAGFTPAYAPAAGTVTIVKNDDAEVAVTNTYRPNAVQIQLKANKVLNTSFDVDPTTFGFIAQSCDANGVVDTAKQPLSGEVTVSSQSKTAQITFGAETFSATGIYYYLISEIDGSVAGVTYSDDRYIVQVEVTDDGTGQLKASEPKLIKRYNGTEFAAVGNNDTLTFTNTYAPKGTQLVLTGDKKLTGRDLKDGEFSFVVTENGKDVTYGINDGEGNIIFQAIPYTTVGDHTYTITEVNSGLKGVDYSTAAYTVTVKVEDVDGQLVATPTYPDGGVVFQNTYTPDDVSLTLTGTKELTGRDLTAGEFSFRVTEVVDGKTVEVTTGKNDGQGNIIFTAIGYSVADVGEHIYTVTEVKPDLAADPNMYYDPAVYQVKVTVSYDQSTGTLSCAVREITKDGTAAQIAFSNIQNPGYVDVPVVGKKQTTGNTVPANLSFSFSVVDMEGNLATGGSAPANGAVSFTNLSYTTTGTYYYWIYETNHAGQTAHGVTYSEQRYLLEVNVTRDAYNKLTYATAYYKAGTVADTQKTAADYAVEANKIAAPADNVLFTNVYAAKGTANITATKTLEDKTLVAGDFMFKLERLDNNGDVLSTLYASNAADGRISFPTILVDSNDLPSGGTATVRYIMSEVVTDANRLPGVTYSNAKYYLTITFTDDGEGNITNEVKYYTDNTFTTLAQSQAAPVFANSYAPEVGTQAVITAKKELSGRPLQAGEFSFNLYHVTTKNGVETETLVDTAVNAADGTVTFTRNYPAGVLNGADEITTKYVIREVNNNLGGVSYDDNNEGKGYPVTVKIVDNKDGSIGCTVTYTNGTTTSDVVFTNTYEANDTTFKPEATKDLKNRDLKNNEFLFVVKEGDKTVSTGYNKADGTVVFTEIGYDRVGEHIYTISETNGGRDDIGYSDATYYLKVTVTDNLDGTMTADGAYFSNAACTAEYKINASDVVFTNTYKPSSISVKLEATKVLRGHAMKDGSFSFLVYDVTDMTKPVASGSNAAADADQTAAINFSNIGYTFDMLSGEGTSREFVYAISEQATTHGGVKADETTYYAKVVLSHDARTGELTTTVTYHTGSTCTHENKIGVPAFVNTYDPTDAKVVLQTNKTLINKKLEAGEFTFKLKGEGVDQSKTNDGNGIAKFDELTFTAPGVYEYTISEKVSSGWNADLYTLDHAFKVIVTVEDDLRGKLVATVTYHEILDDGSYDDTNLGAAEFINRYTAPPATVDLTDSISADKIVKVPDGVTYSPAGFTFKVTDTTGNVIKGWKDGQEEDMIGISDPAGKITFPSFRFTTAGEYHYWISEQPSNVAGMTDDLSVWEVHILVRYNEVTGLLEINSADVKTYLVGRAAAGAAAPEFVNVFEPAAVTLTLEATKLLEGRELKDREFLFYLMEGNTIVAQGYNGVDGKVRFNLTYTAENIGAHAYTIKEVAPENANNGVTYDTKTYVAVTVNVSYDTVGHKLVASVGNTPVANGAVVSTGVTVTNKYTVEGTTAQINAHKVVTANRLLKDKEFTFGLMDSEGKVVATAKNDAAGWITFQLPYHKAGTYIYELFEQPGDDESLRYDTNRYKVTVTVTDDLLGQLHAVVEYENAAVPTFVNEYRALPASATISAQKILKGNKTLAADDFTFELESEDGVKVTTKNAAGGVVTFGMRYDAAGIYTYTLRELAGEAAGVTYDDTEYTVVVTVTDNLEGSLEAAVAYEGLAEGETVPTFVNTYKGKAAAVQIAAAKKLTGKTLTADAYSFTLTNKDNTKDVYTVKNDAKGNVVFDLNLTEVGTYTYILAEATGTDANVTYDKNTYTVTVKVTDDLQGNLKAEVAYETADAKAPTFENFYTPSAVTVVLTGEKTLKGRDLKAEEFSFEVRDAADKVVATAKNTAEGELVFSGIELNAAGKYTFEVCEVKGSVKGMVYDDAKYIVTIEVVNENGELKATVTEPKGGLVFKNTYKAPDPTNPGTGDEMPLLLLVSLMFASAGAMVMLMTSRKKRHA